MDVTRLRRLLKEVDEEHRDTMGSAVDGLAELAFRGERAPSRRSFLRGGVIAAGGSALVIGPLAGAAMAADTTTTTEAATTTTAAPKAPQEADLALLGYAQSLELAAVEVYDPGRVQWPAHARHGRRGRRVQAGTTPITREAIGGLAGKSALGLANQSVIKAFGGRALRANDEAGVLRWPTSSRTRCRPPTAYAIGTLQGTNPAAVLSPPSSRSRPATPCCWVRRWASRSPTSSRCSRRPTSPAVSTRPRTPSKDERHGHPP